MEEDSVLQSFSAVLNFSEIMSFKKTQTNNIFHVTLQPINFLESFYAVWKVFSDSPHNY